MAGIEVTEYLQTTWTATERGKFNFWLVGMAYYTKWNYPFMLAKYQANAIGYSSK